MEPYSPEIRNGWYTSNILAYKAATDNEYMRYLHQTGVIA